MDAVECDECKRTAPRHCRYDKLCTECGFALYGDLDITPLVRKHGATAKFVRAYCRAMGWRRTPQGEPPEWYAAWESWIAKELEAVLTAAR